MHPNLSPLPKEKCYSDHYCNISHVFTSDTKLQGQGFLKSQGEPGYLRVTEGNIPLLTRHHKCYCCIYYLCWNRWSFHKDHYSYSNNVLFHQRKWILKKPTSLTGWWNPIIHFYTLWPSSWNCMYNEASDQDCTQITAGWLRLNPDNNMVIMVDWKKQLKRFYLPLSGRVHLLSLPQFRG